MGSNLAINSTSWRKFPFDGVKSVSVCPLRAKLRTASDCTIAMRRVSTSLHLILSASISAISCLSMVSPLLNLTDSSFHAFMELRCSALPSCAVRFALACFQFDIPDIVKLVSLFENSLQQKQKRLLFFIEYTSQLLAIFSPLTNVFVKYWWWQLLPSLSFFRKTKLGGNLLGPLRTSSVRILSVRGEGQLAGSVDRGSSSVGLSGGSAPGVSIRQHIGTLVKAQASGT